MKIFFSEKIYTLEALMKASYHFTDVAYLHLDEEDGSYVVDIEMKDDAPEDIDPRSFENEVLAQMVRARISHDTKNIRELMMARAFSSTIIKQEVKGQDRIPEDEGRDIDDILTDWFDKYE